MLKPVIAATAMLAIAGSTFVYAQSGGYRGFRDGGPRFEHRHRLSADDVSAFADARIAALKAGLELTPDQTKNWPAFETALRNMVQLRIDRIKAREAAQQQDQSPAACVTVRSAGEARRRHEQAQRRAQADRRCRRAALSEPQRRPKGPLHHAGANSAAASARQATAASGAKAAISIATVTAGAVAGSVKMARDLARMVKTVTAGATATCTA